MKASDRESTGGKGNVVQPWKQGSTGGCQDTGRGGYILPLK